MKFILKLIVAVILVNYVLMSKNKLKLKAKSIYESNREAYNLEDSLDINTASTESIKEKERDFYRRSKDSTNEENQYNTNFEFNPK